jgi:2-dehydro-3-deoxyphosphogluconate aldolase/(4S)-4-hydroxy-2-oxoglutarate aldolase
MLETTQPVSGILDALRPSGILAIIRGVRPEHLVATTRVLADAGVTAMEITLDTPGALEVLAECRAALGPGARLGAGTVLDARTADVAIRSGAQFLVSPHTDAGVISAARDAGVEVVPGALTPSEILAAVRLGATAVKVFPVSAVGGAAYVQALREPLRQVPLIPVGGIHLDGVGAYLRAGAVGVGLGASLVDRTLANQGRLDEIAERARRLVAA